MPTAGIQKRVLSKQRTYYYDDALTGALPHEDGLSVQAHALVHHDEQLAFTAGLLAATYNASSTTVTQTMLTAEGGYLLDSATGDYWAQGGPVWAKTRAREKHGSANPRWQETIQYTDGSGRELLTKVQAPPNGTTPQWIGTGRTVYDNKGNPIKKYEPYLSSTSAYKSEDDIVATGVTPLLRYDPLGRLIRTDFPDGTYAKIVFDAWRAEAWDQNDTVADSEWYATNGALSPLTSQGRAASLAYAHRDTPTTTHYDVLGRAVVVEQHNGFDGSSNAILYETRTRLDIQGNALEVKDARAIVTLKQKYDVLARPIETESAEAGVSRMLPDVGGAPIRTWNSRDVVMRTTFDALRRPTHAYCKIGSATETLVVRTIYGEELGATASKADNLRGQVYRVYDSAGVATSPSRDFKGNLLTSQRSVTKDYTATPDWSAIASLTDVSAIATAAASLLETEVLTTSQTYDALNRIVTSTTPDGSVTTPTYDEANRIKAVEANVRGASTATAFVTAVEYNARGQRESIAYANDTLTEYEYDAKTFRLTRLKTTRTTDSAVLQDLQYWYDPVGNIVEVNEGAQQTVYHSGTVVSPGSKYKYDPLCRLLSAEGREHPAHAGAQVDEVDSPLSGIPHPNDTQALRRYLEEYVYDGVGNILSVDHTKPAAPRRTGSASTSTPPRATG